MPDVEEEIVAALERAEVPLRLRRHDRRDRPDPRRHHRRRRRARFRRFDRRGPARHRHDGGALSRPGELTPARRRMARIPDGAELVDNPVSNAPGFRIGNVFVLAGVPHGHAGDARCRGQVDEDRARRCWSRRSRPGPFPRGATATRSGRSPRRIPTVSIGSYPSYKDGRFNNQIVVRGKDAEAVDAARQAVEAMLAAMRSDGKPL